MHISTSKERSCETKKNCTTETLGTSQRSRQRLKEQLDKSSTTAKYMADFSQGMDDLFDSFNSNQLCEKVKNKQAVYQNSHHVKFWKEKINWLKKWEVVDSERIKCIQGCISQQIL